VFKENVGEIDLVIMDVVMPSQGGLRAYPELAKIKPGIDVIFTSGYAGDAESLVTLDKRALFLAKPYSLAKLSQMMRNILDRKHRVHPDASGRVLPAP